MVDYTKTLADLVHGLIESWHGAPNHSSSSANLLVVTGRRCAWPCVCRSHHAHRNIHAASHAGMLSTLRCGLGSEWLAWATDSIFVVGIEAALLVHEPPNMNSLCMKASRV